MNIFFHKTFDKRFAKLPRKIQLKVLERLDVFRADPFDVTLDNHALIGRHQGSRSVNITGDYRAIFSVLSEEDFLFLDIGTHSQLYK